MGAFVEMNGISKQFPGVLALDCVDFHVRKGEVHALLGENGAGKTTLMNVLYGLYPPTSGEIRLHGEPVRIRTPRFAIKMGLGMVHQHFMLVPALTVVENVILGVAGSRGLILNLDEFAEEIVRLSQGFGMEIDPYAYVWQLSVGEQQRVEIIKALYRGADLLILDEPTAVLTPQEADELFTVIRRLKTQGRSVVFISHKLNEVMEISDRVTVLRGGKSVGVIDTASTSQSELAHMMVGRNVSLNKEKPRAVPGKPILEVTDLRAKDVRGFEALKGLSFTVSAGEVLGIAGVDGNGQGELIEAIAGTVEVTQGSVRLDGNDITNAHPRLVLESGVSHIPGDRQAQGLVLGMTIKENMILATYYRKPFTKGIFMDWDAIGAVTRELISAYQIKALSENSFVHQLSGGNQQKLVLARELSRPPRLILAANPTRGLDIGGAEFVHNQILKARASGSAVLLVSTELEELLALGDRIAVMYEGSIMGVFSGNDADAHEIGLMMAGAKPVA